MVVASPLVMGKAGLAGTKDSLLAKVKDLNDSPEPQSRSVWVHLQPQVAQYSLKLSSDYKKPSLGSCSGFSIAHTLSWHSRPFVIYLKPTCSARPPIPSFQAYCNPQNYPLAPNVPSAFSLVPSLICFSLSLECPLLPHHFCPLILEDTA